MEIRRFTTNDTKAVITLFKDSVHKVCQKDYTVEQLQAWAPQMIDEKTWNERFLRTFTVVAIKNGLYAGFANMDPEGMIDMLYVHAEMQGQGIGKSLFYALKKHAEDIGLERLSSDVSLTACPFFLSLGFKIDQEYSKLVRGVEFRNTLMSTPISK